MRMLSRISTELYYCWRTYYVRKETHGRVSIYSLTSDLHASRAIPSTNFSFVPRVRGRSHGPYTDGFFKRIFMGSR
jgi:hypothetical protein